MEEQNHRKGETNLTMETSDETAFEKDGLRYIIYSPHKEAVEGASDKE